MTDTQLKYIFYNIADRIGMASKRADFVATAVNAGDIQYPLFVLTPLSSELSRPDANTENVSVTCYFFALDAIVSSDGRVSDTTEDEQWAKYDEVTRYASTFCRLLQSANHPVSNMRIERDAYAIGADETIFAKLTFTLTLFISC